MTARKLGSFIVLEGIDGAGTTTQARRLAARLRRRAVSVVLTCEPSRGPVGRHIRRALASKPGPSAQALALLFAADRLDHVENLILPALRQGKIVISDRYTLSSLAYQGAEGDSGWVETLNRHARQPDLTVLLDVDVREATARRGKRGQKSDRYEVTPFQRKVARRYRQLVKTAGDPRIAVVGDGTAAEVAQAIWLKVQPLLGRARASHKKS